MPNYDAAGRALTAMLGYTCLGSSAAATKVHLWPRLEGGWAIEWTGGPHASDVRRELVELSEDPEFSALQPQDVEPVQLDGGALAVVICGEVFALRPVGTIGMDTIMADMFSETP